MKSSIITIFSVIEVTDEKGEKSFEVDWHPTMYPALEIAMDHRKDIGSQNPRIQCSVCGRWMRLHGKRLEVVAGKITEVAVQRFFGGCSYTSGDHLAGDHTDVCDGCCHKECKRLAGCDCQAPFVTAGAAMISEACPVHNRLTQKDIDDQRYLSGEQVAS